MADIDNIGRTAFLISEVRAEEANAEPRLFDDSYARHFSSPGSKAAFQGAQRLGPLFSASLRVRTRWFDDVVLREVERGVAQVLILGAGMDCRALRFPRSGTRYFEVDAPGVLAFKGDRLAAAGVAPGAVTVSTDYLSEGLLDQLAAHGFDRGLSTLVLWEGNTYYLSPEKPRELLGRLARSIADLRVAIDYFGTAIVEGRSRLPSLNHGAALLRQMGAPWQCGIDDLEAMAREAQLQVAERATFAEVMQRLLPHIDLGQDGVHAEISYALLRRPATGA